jgi:transketolase
MRNFFAESLYKKIKKKRDIILLSADIGNRLFDKIKKDFPKNFLNCGIAEPNMVTFASGMAKEGFLPICYTITNFLIYKSIEQIRNDAIYNNNKIILVGTGSGLSYNHLGPTHHSLEDIGLLNNLTKIKILSPSDNNDLEEHLKHSLDPDNKQTTYIRIGKKNEPIINKLKSKINKINYVLNNESKIALIFTGPLYECIAETSKKLKRNNIKIDIINLHQIKPLTTSMLKVLTKYDYIYTLEEHFPNTGIKGILSSNLSDKKIIIKSINNKNEFISHLGSREYVRKKFGISSNRIYKTIVNDTIKNWDRFR